MTATGIKFNDTLIYIFYLNNFHFNQNFLKIIIYTKLKHKKNVQV